MSAGTRGAGGGGPVRAVTGGTVVTPDGEVRADVLIGDGRITDAKTVAALLLYEKLA